MASASLYYSSFSSSHSCSTRGWVFSHLPGPHLALQVEWLDGSHSVMPSNPDTSCFYTWSDLSPFRPLSDSDFTWDRAFTSPRMCFLTPSSAPGIYAHLAPIRRNCNYPFNSSSLISLWAPGGKGVDLYLQGPGICHSARPLPQNMLPQRSQQVRLPSSFCCQLEALSDPSTHTWWSKSICPAIWQLFPSLWSMFYRLYSEEGSTKHYRKLATAHVN